MPQQPQPKGINQVFTARKRSLRRLCFRKRLSFYPRGVGSASRGGGLNLKGRRHPEGVDRRPPSDTTRYGQRAGGTHRTGMHSC